MFNKFNPAERRKLIAELTRSQRQELCWKTASINGFTQGLVGIRLRPYQLQAAKAIIKSVFDRDGESFVIIFARQSGKDELLADLILFLLARLAFKSVSIVCAQPTFRPQTVNAMERLYARAHQRPFFVDGGFSKRRHPFMLGRRSALAA